MAWSEKTGKKEEKRKEKTNKEEKGKGKGKKRKNQKGSERAMREDGCFVTLKAAE